VLKRSAWEQKLDAETGSLPWLDSTLEGHSCAKREVLVAGAKNAAVLALPNRPFAAALRTRAQCDFGDDLWCDW
jgi:hypothetical protein